jgi:hypothetical protein
MKTTSVGALLVFISACRPDVGAPISLISGPAILAVKAEPAEVDLRVAGQAGQPVRYEALVVDSGGRVPNADITDPLLWSVCDQPKPPTENNAVSSICLDRDYLPGEEGDSPTSYRAPVPDDSCKLFGPITPPVDPPIRPRDPDVTGGYYLPVRMELWVPEELRRVGMATADSLLGIHLQRINCGLANFPSKLVREYNANYKLNQNPVLNPLTLQVPGADPVEVPAALPGNSPFPLTVGQSVLLTASWPAESVENYPAPNVLVHELRYINESMRVSWYVTAGSFKHDITGRSEAESETFTENTWKPSEPGLVHLWVVLHDSRGGTDFAAYDFDVQP